jgi:hypothetical protein
MTPRTLAIAPATPQAPSPAPGAPPTAGPRYACTACESEWSYHDVRHVLCCPECGGGLWRRDPPAERDAPQRSGRSG